MEEKFEKFKKYLEYHKKSETTRKTYPQRARQLDNWLRQYRIKTIETANESDLRGWGSHIISEHKSRWQPYFHGVQAYYTFTGAEFQKKIIEDIISKAPKPPRERKPLIRFEQFQSYLSQIEKENPNPMHFALLNLLWSEMRLKDIVNLRNSDVDFEKRTILNRNNVATKEAWKALEKIKPSDNAGKNEPLFVESRQAQQKTKDYLGKYGLTPEVIHRSCEEDLRNVGRTVTFVGSESDSATSVETKQEGTVNQLSDQDFVGKIVKEISNFGDKLNVRIGKIKDEKELQHLLEGYLISALPNEKIFPQYPFQGYKTGNSIIDFVVGKEEVPLELKLGNKKEIGDCIRDGSAQVKEFLKFRKSDKDKGILVIGDKDRDPESKRHNGVHDQVYIIVI